MLITDTFILLNYPKTGSTFARKVIEELYHRRLQNRMLLRKCSDRLRLTARPFIRELILDNIRIHDGQRKPDHHGCYCQIPNIYRNREIVTVVRNPYDRLISAYEYGSWRNRPPVPDKILAELFPSFPDLDFEDFVCLCEYLIIHGRLNGRSVDGNIGSQTVQFIQMFFKNPEHVLNELSDSYIDSDQIFEDFAPITFLKQENLRKDLANFLVRKGFPEEDARYVLSHEKVNVTKNKVTDRNALWTEKSLNYVKQNERMIFRILSAKGIFYEKPF